MSINPDKKKGAGFGTSKRKGLSDTEDVPGPGNYNYAAYKKSEKAGYTIPMSSKDPKIKAIDGGKNYDTRGRFPDTANYALPAPKDRKIKPPEF
jgi:hypothetical protein